ncbi:hypothetical protein BH09PSE1_BH09PSE1_04900 [soil metagenome]
MSSDAAILFPDFPKRGSARVRRVVRPVPALGRTARVIDVAIAAAALVFLAPLLLLVALIVKLADGGPALFRQERIGQGGRVFKCLKFRSMVMDADVRLNALLERDPVARAEWDLDHKLRNDPRITALGRFLRKSSLDELPQLINVICGDMSIVGPRPIVASEVSRYRGYFAHYCSVRPGITGLWQVSGRNNVSYRRRVACDVMYARTHSLPMNIRIMAATVPAVTFARGSF